MIVARRPLAGSTVCACEAGCPAVDMDRQSEEQASRLLRLVGC